MDLKYFYKRQLYLLKQKIEAKSERDRILLLFIIISILSLAVFFTILQPEENSSNLVEEQIPKVQEQIKTLTEKKDMLKKLSDNPSTVQAITRMKEVTDEFARMEKILTRVNARYIKGRDLAKLLHGMLKQTMGVTIEHFATVPPPPEAAINPQVGTASHQEVKAVSTPTPVSSPTSTGTPTATQTSTPAPSQSQMPAPIIPEKTYYRLVLRGTYFPIMDYLQLLEKLPWQLYWDRFEYKVVNYPEARAIIDFYTLKPQSAPKTKQGST